MVRRATLKAAQTYAAYVLRLRPTRVCRHAEPFDFYVGSTHEAPGHPATARITEHRSGYKSRVTRAGYSIVRGEVVHSGLSARDQAETAEGTVADEIHSRGFKVWCDR